LAKLPVCRAGNRSCRSLWRAERRLFDPARGFGDYQVAFCSVCIAPLWIPDLVAATRRDSLGRRSDRQADGSVRWSIRPDAH